MKNTKISVEGRTVDVKEIAVDTENYIIYEGNKGNNGIYYLDFLMELSAFAWSETCEISPEEMNLYFTDKHSFDQLIENYRTREYQKIEEHRQRTGWYKWAEQERNKKQNP